VSDETSRYSRRDALTQQLAWLASDLKGRSTSTPLVVFAHMPLWTIYEPWGWGTGDADQLMGWH
jgi:hypothetical protein